MPDEDLEIKDDASELADDSKRKRAELRPFPRKPLSEALKVVDAIKNQNAGKPWSPAQLADALNRKQRSSDFQYIVAGARDFGLVDGNFRSDTITLTPLGAAVAYAKSDREEKDGQFKAFTNVELFRQVYEYYKGSKLPEHKYVSNILVNQFKLPFEHVDEFIKIFEGNCRFLGIDVSGTLLFNAPLSEPSPEQLVESVKPIVRSGRFNAFVIMPFVEKAAHRHDGFFKEVLNSLIKPAAGDAGFDVESANIFGTDLIQSTIINKLLDADLVIADLSDHNPNVMFELGLRVADNKGPIVLLKASDTGRLFDVDNMMRVYEYSPSLWPSTLEVDRPNLEKHIRAAWENRTGNTSYMDILRRKSHEG